MNDKLFSERQSILLAFLVLGWLLIRLFSQLQGGRWIAGGFFIDIFVGLAALCLFLPVFTASVIELIKCIRNRQLPHYEIVAIIALIGSFWVFPLIPTYPGYIYQQHKDEFHSVVKKGIERFSNSNSHGIKLSRVQSYSGNMYSDNHHNGDTIFAEFVINDFYLPLVYIQSDNPEDVYDTCSAGGSPIEKLDENWYVCSRDWN